MAALQKLSRSVLRSEGVEQTGRMEAVRNATERLASREAYAQELSRLWREAQERFVAIGEYLMYAKDTLPHGEYEKMIAHDLPFGRAVAHALRTVAVAINEGRIERIELPKSYTTAYYLVTLKPHQLQLAREQGLVHPDVARSKIDAFRRQIKTGPDQRRKLLDEKRRLEKQLDTIRNRLLEIDTKLSEVELNPDEIFYETSNSS